MSDARMIGSITLPAVPESVREARRFASGRLATPTSPDLRDRLELLVSEAATNSVTHSDSRHGGTFTLHLYALDGGGIRAEVIDDGGSTVPTRLDPEALSTSGRGVALIETIAARSGWQTDEQGSLHIWFDLDPEESGQRP